MTTRHDPTDRLRAWTHRRQRLGRAAPDAAAALRDVVAVYSSQPSSALSLLSRAAAISAADLAAMEERREAIRIPALRLSIFFAPTELAPRLVAATRQPRKVFARNLAWAGLDDAGYERVKEQVLAVAREPRTVNELKRAVPIEERLMTAVRLMSYEGLILRLSSSLRTDALRYVVTDAWLGAPLPEADPDESLAWLAEAYLRAFGPARLADLAWWVGVTKGRAAAALKTCPTVDVGAGLLLPADQEAAFASVEPLDPAALDLLPKWDAYTMGYAPDGRQRLLADVYLTHAYTGVGGRSATSGDGLPLLLRGGRAVASWSHRFDGDRLRVSVTPFPGVDPPPRLDESSFAEIGRLLGASTIAVARAA